MLKVVIFDLDGTVVDVFDKHLSAFQTVIKNRWGLDFTAEDLKNGYGRTAAEIAKIFFKKHGIVDVDYERFVEERKRVGEKFMEGDVKVLPGARKLLEALEKDEIKIALATSCMRGVTDKILTSSKLLGYFDAVVTAEDVTIGKPDPEIFLRAAEKLGVRAEECVVIEDSTHGVEAAKNGNMKVVGVLTGIHKREELGARKPSMIVNTLKDVSVGDLKALMQK